MIRHPLKRPAALVAMVILALAAAGMGTAISKYKLSIRKLPIYPKDNRQLIDIARETRSWVQIGSDQPISKEIEEELGTKNHLTRAYYWKNSPDKSKPIVLQLHLAYYTGMIDTVPHVPDRCFVGAGMSIDGIAGDLPVPLDRSAFTELKNVPEKDRGHLYQMRIINPHDEDTDSNYVNLPRDPDQIQMRITRFTGPKIDPHYSGYFFVANGGTVASGDGVRLLAFDLRSKYAYYLKVQFTSATVDSAEQLALYSAKLLDDLFGDILLCVPDWVEVEAGRYPPAPVDNGAQSGNK